MLSFHYKRYNFYSYFFPIIDFKFPEKCFFIFSRILIRKRHIKKIYKNIIVTNKIKNLKCPLKAKIVPKNYIKSRKYTRIKIWSKTRNHPNCLSLQHFQSHKIYYYIMSL